MRERSGFLFTIGAYLFWGGFPAFFVLLSSVDAFEIIPWRTLWSLVFSLLVVLAMRNWRQLWQTLSTPRTFWFLALAGVLLYVNWQTFVWATVNGDIIETSLGYFINPFVTILLGVVFRGERIRRLQWTALGVALIAVLVLSVSYGHPPWLALLLAFSFGFYGFVKKQTAQDIDAAVGMTVETIALVPVAIIQLFLIWHFSGALTALSAGFDINLLLALSGPVTVIPLLMFAAGTKRLPLVYVGFIQFMTPVLSFLYGYFVMHEAMSLARWAGFIIVWIALVILLVDIARRMRLRGASVQRSVSH